jgi:signal transduction histidine kinase
MLWASAAAAAAIGLACLVGVLAAGAVGRAAESRALGRADLAAEAAAQQAHHLLENIDTLIDQAQLALRLDRAGLPEAAAAVAADIDQTAERDAVGVTGVSIVDEAGRRLWPRLPAGAEPGATAPPPFMPALRNSIQLQADAAPTRPTATAQARGTLHFARSVRDAAGHFAGFGVVAIDPLILSARMARAGLGKDTAALLVQLPQGRIVADSAASLALLDRRPTLDAADLARIVGSRDGRAESAAASAGRPGFIAFRRLTSPGTGLGEALIGGDGALAVVAVVDAGRALGPAGRERQMIALAVAVFAALAGAALAARAMLLRRRRERTALAAAWRQVGAVKAVRAELERLLTSLPVAAYQARVQPDGQYVRRYVSPMLSHITGWPMHALADAAQWERKLEEGPATRLTEFFASVLHDGEGTIEYRMRRPDGGWCWLRETARVAARVPNGGGEVIGAISDVTTEGELALQAAMTSKLTMLGEMASGLAHELNQPVTVIGLAADRVQDALDNSPADLPAAARALATIAAQVQRSGEIIDQLRLFGRGDAMPVGPVQLDQAVSGAMVLAEGPLRDAGITLRIDLPDSLPLVQGRLVQIEQVLVNLCINARDALLGQPEGRRHLAISAEAEAGRVRLRVTDTGGGISSTVMPRLFDPFVTSKAPGSGSGLGLSICQRLMRGMTGDIGARNTEDGAEFTLSFRTAAQNALVVGNPRHP